MATRSVIHPVQRSHSRKALTPEEILKVPKIASESKLKLAMILLAHRHGMRASDSCDLRLSDLDLKNGEVTIRRLKGSLRTVQPLSDHPGQPLLSEKRVLRAWLTERRDASDFVFVPQKGGRIHRSQFFRTFQSVAERAGVSADRRHPHCSSMLSDSHSLRATSTCRSSSKPSATRISRPRPFTRSQQMSRRAGL
jgi:integrase